MLIEDRVLIEHQMSVFEEQIAIGERHWRVCRIDARALDVGLDA
jgi:hypothetical protein